MSVMCAFTNALTNFTTSVDKWKKKLRYLKFAY